MGFIIQLEPKYYLTPLDEELEFTTDKEKARNFKSRLEAERGCRLDSRASIYKNTMIKSYILPHKCQGYKGHNCKVMVKTENRVCPGCKIIRKKLSLEKHRVIIAAAGERRHVQDYMENLGITTEEVRVEVKKAMAGKTTKKVDVFAFPQSLWEEKEYSNA